MATISVVLATFNEEENLPACLDSAKDLADEIVVVDGGSSDRTVEVAKRYGAKVKITNNPPIFHINKQKAIDAATRDWILQLDADERVTPLLRDEIKYQISLRPELRARAKIKDNEINGYWIPRKNWFLGRFLMKGGQYPDYTLRLYRRGKGELPQKSIHEQAIVEGDVGYLRNPLLHYSFPNFSSYIKRFNKYTKNLALEMKNNHTKRDIKSLFLYLFFKPVFEFFRIYIRHKGFLDGWQGFVFALFSSLRFPVGYIKYSKSKL